MRLSLKNSTSLTRRGGVFSPSALFASSESGAWYDPSDLSTMSQGSDGTTAAVVGQPVGRIMDKSGRGNHAIQATTSAKPILRHDGTNYYLEFDGVDDYLKAAFTVAQPWDRVSAIRQVTWSDLKRIFDGVDVTAGLLFQTGASPQLAVHDGSNAGTNGGAAVGANAVATERHDNTNSRLAINNGAYATGTSGTAVPGGITIGATSAGANPSSIHLYGVTMIGRALTDAETANLRTYMASKSGVIL